MREPSKASAVFGNITYPGSSDILLVRRNYGLMQWAQPGGEIEDGESVMECCVRETLEETGFFVRVLRQRFRQHITQLGIVVICMDAEIASEHEWEPNDEIAEYDFFTANTLPKEISPTALQRIQAAAQVDHQARITFSDALPEQISG